MAGFGGAQLLFEAERLRGIARLTAVGPGGDRDVDRRVFPAGPEAARGGEGGVLRGAGVGGGHVLVREVHARIGLRGFIDAAVAVLVDAVVADLERPGVDVRIGVVAVVPRVDVSVLLALGLAAAEDRGGGFTEFPRPTVGVGIDRNGRARQNVHAAGEENQHQHALAHLSISNSQVGLKKLMRDIPPQLALSR